MRLLYLRLPDYPPLKDIEVLFQQETILQRQGAVNFVVGVNGTGKSSLLRAIYETFRFLDREEVPPFPVTIGYQITEGRDFARIVFHYSGGAKSEAVFQRQKVTHSPNDAPPSAWSIAQWRHWIDSLSEPPFSGDKSMAPELRFYGHELKGNSAVAAGLPKQILAYTSGDTRAWERPALSPFRLEDIPGTGIGMSVEDWPDERPFGWTQRDEEIYQAGQSERRPSSLESQKFPAKPERNQRCLLLNSEDIRLAGIAFGLWAASNELPQYQEEAAIKKWRNELRKQIDDCKPAAGFRRLLQEVDWWYPTHVSFRIDPARIGRSQRERRLSQLFALYAGAEEVMLHPLGRQQAVWCLTGRRDARGEEAGQNHFGDQRPEFLSDCLRQIEFDRHNALAAVGLFTAQIWFWDLFQELRSWKQEGFLERLDLTVKRIHTCEVDRDKHKLDGDDVVLTYDSLSDGEQMLLGRMALLFLLQDHEHSLLLLDEPETHFNDVWKREIIDIIDESILKDTSVQVFVATHSSIALTDVFKSEITLLRRDSETQTIFEANEPIETFGASPSDIMRDVFGAEDTVGSRATQFLDIMLIIASAPKEVAAFWLDPRDDNPALNAIFAAAQSLPYSFRNREQVGSVLRSVIAYTRTHLKKENPDYRDSLSLLRTKLGPGHYRFEFNRRLRGMEVIDAP